MISSSSLSLSFLLDTLNSHELLNSVRADFHARLRHGDGYRQRFCACYGFLLRREILYHLDLLVERLMMGFCQRRRSRVTQRGVFLEPSLFSLFFKK